MRTWTGRILQGLGLAIVLIGLFTGVSLNNVRLELMYLGVGVVVFYGGRYVETGKLG